MQTDRYDFNHITTSARDSLRRAYGLVERTLPEDLKPRQAKRTEKKTTTPPVIVLDDSGDDDVPLSERLHRYGTLARSKLSLKLCSRHGNVHEGTELNAMQDKEPVQRNTDQKEQVQDQMAQLINRTLQPVPLNLANQLQKNPPNQDQQLSSKSGQSL